ncbi:hypothetical protein [Brachybacterium fresconis]|uniref:Uncharacterized protein n=1 Tax=Brachybacterium fresconis TaxID=173363 RepID=A0ABS4YGL8_9MICO|nr:hypothetical protein [Brachybacterium fresconis]MBP2407943.1 hypothetical protein [Brachybacterium fresconis]
MTARRSEDPAGRDSSRDGSAAAAYWTPTRRREARPAQIRKDPPSSRGPVDGAQDVPVRPAAEPEEATTSSDAPGAGTAEEGAEERGDDSGPDAEGSAQK